MPPARGTFGAVVERGRKREPEREEKVCTEIKAEEKQKIKSETYF